MSRGGSKCFRQIFSGIFFVSLWRIDSIEFLFGVEFGLYTIFWHYFLGFIKGLATLHICSLSITLPDIKSVANSRFFLIIDLSLAMI